MVHGERLQVAVLCGNGVLVYSYPDALQASLDKWVSG